MFYDEEALAVSVVSVVNLEWGKQKIKVRRRPYSALSFRVRGEGRITTADQTVDMSEGDILFLPQNVDYIADYTEGEILVIHFECKNKSFDKIENYTVSDPKAVLPLFRRAYSAWHTKRIGYRLEITAIIYEILLAIRRQASNGESEDGAFSRAMDIIRSGYKDPELRITDVCLKAGISDSYLRRMTKRYYGMHPVRYLTELRLSYAETLLRHPSVSVEQAAVDSGFADPKYFARVVKKLRGCSPSELRSV